jgi:hypothetical protein
MSFSMFITNEVTRIAWFGVANVLIARFALPVGVQWGLYIGGIAAAFVVAFAFHTIIDQPMQNPYQGLVEDPPHPSRGGCRARDSGAQSPLKL